MLHPISIPLVGLTLDELLLIDLDLVSNARRQSLGGRTFLVAEAVILKPQVLPGSDGPLFYPLDEISTNIGGWNGFPLTAQHPWLNVEGKKVNVSARIPEIANRFQIGTVYNDRMVGDERRVDIWVDIEVANRIDDRIVPAIEKGSKVNVSTGIFLQKVPTPGAVFNGKSHTHSVKNIRADHLAILMDERGACSVDDGCGVNIRNTNPLEDLLVNKDQLVTWLVTNCECWKGEAGKTTLNTLDLVQLTDMKTNAEKAKVADPLSELVKNLAGKVGFKDSDPRKLTDFVVNALGEKDQQIEAAKKVVTPVVNGDPTQDQVLNALKGLTGAQRIDLLAPAGSQERQFIDTAKQVHEEKRIAVIKQLTANVTDPEEKKAKLLKLKDKDLATLNEYLEWAVANAKAEPTKDDTDKYLQNFFGQQGATGTPARKVTNQKDILRPFPDLGDDEQVA